MVGIATFQRDSLLNHFGCGKGKAGVGEISEDGIHFAKEEMVRVVEAKAVA